LDKPIPAAAVATSEVPDRQRNCAIIARRLRRVCAAQDHCEDRAP